MSDIDAKLKTFCEGVRSMPGIQDMNERRLLASDISQSLQRHLKLLEKSKSTVPDYVIEPGCIQFNPFNTAISYQQLGNEMEAWWLIFLACWFGENSRTGWKLLYSVYNGLNSGKTWNWQAVADDPAEFSQWLQQQQPYLKRAGLLGDNHKKKVFDVCRAEKASQVLSKFIYWWASNYNDIIGKSNLHCVLSPGLNFRFLYQALSEGIDINPLLHYRLLTWAGILGVANVEPDRPFLVNGSSYKKSARQMFQASGPKLRGRELAQYITELAAWLDIPFCFSVLEDAISNRHN